MNRFMSWMTPLLQKEGNKVLRTKGVFNAHSFKERVVFQSVRMLTTMSRFEAWKDDSTRQTEFVVIGRNLDQKAFQTGLESCIAG